MRNMKSSVHLTAAVALLAATQFAGGTAAHAQSTGTVNFATHIEQIDGFGFADPFGRAGYLQNSPAIRDAVTDALFNPVTGAGLTMYRIGLSPNDNNIEPNAPASPSATPTYVWDGNDSGQVYLAQRAQQYGVRRFYLDSWGAPGFMKTNANTNNGGQICGMPGSTACASGDWRQAYASYVVQVAKFYKQSGVNITDINFVNEPDQNVTYASLTLSTAQVIDFLKNYWGPTVQAANLGMKISCCDHSKWSGAITYTNAINADPVAAAYVNTFTGHEYGSLPTTPLNTTKNTWMSEWASANGTAFNDSWDKTENGSNQNNGIHLANDISAALTKANISAYLYWYADSVGLTGGFFSLTATTNDASYVLTKRLWAIGGFARFVRPGAHRVPATTNNSSLAITAFINTNGNKVINVVNNATTIVNANLTLDAASANAIPTAYFTDENNSVAPTNIASVTGTTLSAAFAPRSMTSIVLTPAPVSGTIQLITVNTLEKFGDGSYQATVKISNMGTGTARDIQLTAAELGSTAGSTMPTAALPFTLGDLGPGASTTVAVNYPASAGTSGSPTVEKITGSYTGGVFGNGTFGGSMRVTLP